MNVNLWIGVGRLTRDPELRHTDAGTAVTEVGLAVNRKFTTAGGVEKTDTCFVDIVFWARKAELICEHAKKGTALYIRGRLELDQWKGPDNVKRSRLRVVANEFQFVDKPEVKTGPASDEQ